jgi:small-conductance mechanosensitive channel
MMRIDRRLIGCLWLLAASLSPVCAPAQSDTVSNAELRREVAILKAKIQELERENRQLKSLSEQIETIQRRLDLQQAQAPNKTRSLPSETSSKGFVVRSPNGD